MKVSIGDIRVRDRLREEMGNLSGLIESIRLHGLIHPIVIDDSGNLVAGRRRLAACKEIGMEAVEVRKFGELGPKERRVLELEENLHRKDLTAYERSKVTIQYNQAAVEASRKNIVHKVHENGRPGRPSKAGSRRRTEDLTGIPNATVRKAEAHVKAAERYPFLAGPAWNQAVAIESAEALDALPPEDRKRTLRLIDKYQAPAPAARPMIQHIAHATPERRRQIWKRIDSEDPRESGGLVSLLADTAPLPDPRLLWLSEVVRQGKKEAARFPKDPVNPEILEFVKRAEDLAAKIDKRQHEIAEEGREILK